VDAKAIEKPVEKHILFLDGDCVMCQKTAQRLYRWDLTQTIFFSALQGQTASMLPSNWRNTTDAKGRPSGNAVLVERAGQDNECRWQGANAILRSLLLTKSPLALCWIFYYIPGFLKNRFYGLVARNRHRLISNKSCPLPSQSFKDRFLP